jgi:hypothetical protein
MKLSKETIWLFKEIGVRGFWMTMYFMLGFSSCLSVYLLINNEYLN